MSGLREPGLGPIIGHTTDTSSRIWIRAGDPGDDNAELNADRRTLGVIAVVAENGQAIPEDKINVHYFRLRREFDRTGTFVLGEDTGIKELASSKKLQPGTLYQVRVGTLTIDDPFKNDDNISSDSLAGILPDPSVWRRPLLKLDDKFSSAEFRTFPTTPTGKTASKVSFLLGSCRYPGLLWKAKLADKIFGSVKTEAEVAREGGKPCFVLMVGDQIYADKLNRHIPIGLADTYAEFQERYLTAFGSGNMRKLLRSLPTYMILDDHEIEDNWSRDRLRDSAKARLFNLAIGAYMSYQWSHGPRNFGARLFYNFACGGLPFFVLDTRTQRYIDDVRDSLDDNHLLGRPSLADEEPNQLNYLLRWLVDAQNNKGNVPKFIVSSSVFVPNPMDARVGASTTHMKNSDSWPAFPETRKAILQTIVDHSIQNVVFLSGDIHCSNIAQLVFNGTPEAKKLKTFSITSSAFYWPFPFADGSPSDFVHDSTAPGQEDTFVINENPRLVMDYTAWNFTQVDNFCRIDVDRKSAALIVRAFDSDGKQVVKPRQDGTSTLLEHKFELEKW